MLNPMIVLQQIALRDAAGVRHSPTERTHTITQACHMHASKCKTQNVSQTYTSIQSGLTDCVNTVL